MPSLAEAGLEGPSLPLVESLQRFRHAFGKRYQTYLDKATPHVTYRWAATAFLLFLYILRVYLLQGFYVVTYGLAIYTLNLLIGFLSPMNDPDENDAATELPINAITPSDTEWKPFMRKIPEFKVWHLFSRYLLVSFFCTFIPFLDVPVVWQVLFVYFIILMIGQLKGRIQHMIKHRYLPASSSKPQY